MPSHVAFAKARGNKNAPGCARMILAPLASRSDLLRGAAALLRNFRSRPARFGETDRDRLLAARNLLPGAARPERSPFAFAHRALDLALGLRTVPAGSRLS